MASVEIVPAAIPPIRLVAIALLIPMKPDDVPITMGSLPPMGPMGYNWMNVINPAMIIAFCSRATRNVPNPSPSVMPHVARITRSGDRFPTNMARTCCNPSGMAWESEMRPFNEYGEV